MPRPQFTLRALLVLMLSVGCFFGGIRFERERRRRADESAARMANRDFQGVYLSTMQQTARRLGQTKQREKAAHED